MRVQLAKTSLSLLLYYGRSLVPAAGQLLANP